MMVIKIMMNIIITKCCNLCNSMFISSKYLMKIFPHGLVIIHMVPAIIFIQSAQPVQFHVHLFQVSCPDPSSLTPRPQKRPLRPLRSPEYRLVIFLSLRDCLYDWWSLRIDWLFGTGILGGLANFTFLLTSLSKSSILSLQVQDKIFQQTIIRIQGLAGLQACMLNKHPNLISPISDGAPETRSWRDSICLFIRSCDHFVTFWIFSFERFDLSLHLLLQTFCRIAIVNAALINTAVSILLAICSCLSRMQLS